MNTQTVSREAHTTAADRQQGLPNAFDAEMQLLGALMINNEAFDYLPAEFEGRLMFEPFFRRVFDAMTDLRKAGTPVNPVTVKSMMPADLTARMIGDMTVSQYLAHLCSEAASILHVPDYAGAIIDAAAMRQMVTIGQSLQDIGFGATKAEATEEGEALKNALDATLGALAGRSAKTMASASRTALTATLDAFTGKSLAGVDYGFAPLAQMIGPAMPGQLIIVGGGTKQGKSSLIEQLIMGSAINGHPVWVYSGEMGATELAQRAMSRLSGIEAWRQTRGKVSEAEYEKLVAASRDATRWQNRIFIHDDPMTISAIEREVIRFGKLNPSGIVVIDHIGLVERDKNSARMTEQEFGPMITRALKMLAQKARVPVVAAAQLKKNTFAAESNRVTKAVMQSAISRRPRYTDLIGACEKDANHVIIPFRAEPILQDLEPAEESPLHLEWEDLMGSIKNRAEIGLALSRHTKWPQRREVVWNGEKTMFIEKTNTERGLF